MYDQQEGKHMKILNLSIAILAASASLVAVQANAYQFEVGAGAGYVDPDHGSSGSELDFNGKYYFDNVQSKDAPLAEAAFVNRASNVSLNANLKDVGDNDNNTYGAGIEYFVPNSDFYLNGNVSRQNVEQKRPHGGKIKNETTLYGAEVGYLPVANLLLAVGVKGYDNDNDDGVDPTIRAKYVTQLGGKDINLEAGAAFGDLDEFNLAADYFIDKTFSVGADYYSNDISDTNEFGINARKFINPQTSVEGRIGFGEVGNNDYNSFGVAAKYRF